MTEIQFFAPSGLGLVDWHVTDTAAVIANKRRLGWSDAQITHWLLNDAEGKNSCPWGCDDEKVNAAFVYLATGKLPGRTKTTTDTGTDSDRRVPGWVWWVGGAVLVLGGVGAVVAISTRSR